MPAPRGQKAATKPGRRAAAHPASGPTTQLNDLPDSVLGLIFSLAGDTCGCAGLQPALHPSPGSLAGRGAAAGLCSQTRRAHAPRARTAGTSSSRLTARAPPPGASALRSRLPCCSRYLPTTPPPLHRPNISAVSRRWRRVWYSEPAVWREFVLRPVPPPEAALRLDRLWRGAEEDWQPASEGDLSETEAEAVTEGVAEWWECASERQVAAGFAARRRQLRQTAHLVTHARLDYGCSGLQEQPCQPSDWKLWQVVRELPASLEGLHLDSWVEMEDVTRGEAKELVAATTDALARFSQLTALQVGVFKWWGRGGVMTMSLLSIQPAVDAGCLLRAQPCSVTSRQLLIRVPPQSDSLRS